MPIRDGRPDHQRQPERWRHERPRALPLPHHRAHHLILRGDLGALHVHGPHKKGLYYKSNCTVGHVTFRLVYSTIKYKK